MTVVRFLLFLLCLLAGCATPPTGPERMATAKHLAALRGWQAVALDAGNLSVMAWVPAQPPEGEDLAVYIEGDGLAWLSGDLPSDDPTPLSPIGLQLALAQVKGNAAYLARPCQYTADQPACRVAYWTSRRFAPEIIAAMDSALNIVKRRFQTKRLTLVGYSGGGALAALLAARRTDVVRLVTVAGNLDHAAWTTLHRVSPLTGSLNPMDERDRLAAIPQWHFVGGLDKVVPPRLAQSFAMGMPQARVIVLPEYGHQCCWTDHWSSLWQAVK